MDNQSNSVQERFWQLFTKKLCGEAAEDELQEYADLLILHPHWQMQADMITQMWGQRQKECSSSDAENAYIRHLVKYKEVLFPPSDSSDDVQLTDVVKNAHPEDGYPDVPGRRPRRKWLIMSSTLSLIAAIGWYLMSTKNTISADSEKKPPTSSVATKNGNRTKMVLPDGSQVWLNAGSRLDYNDKEYNKTLREVSLSGEAFFDVTENKLKPFVIHTSKVNIKVLGTAFNVKSYPDEKLTETSLIRGSVEVTVNSRPTEKYILKPTEKLVIADEEKPVERPASVAKATRLISRAPAPMVAISRLSYLPADSTIVETGWMDNKFIFRSEEFDELARRMERWYGVTIRFRNNAIAREKFTGIFERETIEQALGALQMTAFFKYDIQKNEVIIY